MPNISEADGSVIVEITGDDTGLRNTLNDVNNAVRNTAQQASQTAQQAVNAASQAANSAAQASNSISQLTNAASQANSAMNNAAGGANAYNSALDALVSAMNQCNSSLSNIDSRIASSASNMQNAAGGASNYDAALANLLSVLSQCASSLSNIDSQITATAANMQNAAGGATDYSAALSRLESILARCEGSLNSMDGSLGEISQGMRSAGDSAESTDGILQKLGGTLQTVFSIALIKEFLGYVEQVGSEFEYTLDKVSTIADTSVKSVGEISEEILALSSESGVSGAELNETMYQAISAGVDTADAINMVETAVKSAKAGFTDTTTAVDGLTTVLNSYKDAQLDADDVANKFLITQNLGKTSFGEIASTIGNIAPTANAANVSIEELLAGTAALTANGIQTSQAMTGMKAALSNIITPSSTAAKKAEELGIEFNAAALKSKGLGGFLKDLAEATEGDTETMAQLFGSVEALNTVLTLTSNGGAELFDKAMSEMQTNTTALDDAYETMTDNLQSDLDVMKVNAENFGIDLYNIFSGDMQNVVQVVTVYIGRLRDAMTTGGFSGLAQELFQIAFDAIVELGNGIANALPTLIPAALDAVWTVADTIANNVDKIIDTGIKIIESLGEGLVSPETQSIYIEKAPIVIADLLTALEGVLEDVTDFGLQIAAEIVMGIMGYDFEGNMSTVYTMLYNIGARMHQNLIDGYNSKTKEKHSAFVESLKGMTESELYALNAELGNSIEDIQKAWDAYDTAVYSSIDDFIEKNADTEYGKILAKMKAEAEENNMLVADYINTKISGIREQQGLIADALTSGDFKKDFAAVEGQNLYPGAAGALSGKTLTDIADTAETAFEEVSESAAESADSVTESTGKISEEFKAWYTELETLKAHGDIDDDEFKKRLSDKLHSSAEYLDSAYNSYWEKIGTSNSKAAAKANKQISEDFKKSYDELERLLSLGVDNGGISEEEYYDRLEKLLDNDEYKNDPAYNSYRSKLKSYRDKQGKEAERKNKEVSEDFKQQYDNLKLLFDMGEENGGISEEEYYSRLEKLLESIPDSKVNAAYSQYWKALKSYNQKEQKEAEKQQAAVSESFKKWYDEQQFLLAKGVENGGISKEQYIENLREMLESSDEFDKVQYKPYWKEVTTADEKAAQENQKAIDEAAKKRLKALKDEAKDELAQLKSSIAELQSEYKTELTKLVKERDSFKSKLSVNIFSTTEETVTDKRTGDVTKKKTDTVADIQKKIEARKKLGEALKSLASKETPIPKGLLQELAGMDPDDALRFAEQLDKLDNTQWENIVSSYNEYEEINNKIAEDIYNPQITALNEKFAADLDTVLDGVSGTAAEKGAELIRSYISGVDLSSDDAIQQIKDFGDDVVSEMKSAVDGAGLIDGGLMLGEDFAQAIADGFADNAAVIGDTVLAAWGEIFDEKFPSITAAVDTRTTGLSQGIATRAVASQEPAAATVNQAAVNVPDITLSNIQLVMKDGKVLAEVVNKENLNYQIQGGRI